MSGKPGRPRVPARTSSRKYNVGTFPKCPIEGCMEDQTQIPGFPKYGLAVNPNGHFRWHFERDKMKQTEENHGSNRHTS